MMGSALGWVSFGSAEAEAVNALMGTLSDSEARDELGLGVIRDGFSNLLFPGTSTVQTRLRYFLMIPRIFQALDLKARDLPGALRAAEAAFITGMLALPADADRAQLIGVEAGARLKRMPSAIYWGGLGTWGIRLDDRAPIAEVLQRMAQGEACWTELPAALAGDAQDFTLGPDEAEWIVDRCTALRQGRTVLGALMSEAKTSVAFTTLDDVARSGLPSDLQDQLDHALAFSRTVHGAALLYNLLLAEKFKPDAAGEWEKALEEWQRRGIPPAPSAQGLIAPLLEHRAEIGFRPNGTTLSFIEAWLGVMHDPTGKEARDLITDRERQAKPGRARLQMTGDYRWSGSAGAGQLNFRWDRVLRYLEDVTGTSRRAGA